MDAETMGNIRRDFLPADLKPILDDLGINGTVAVQADQSAEETAFLLNLARENDLVSGVVGWVDFKLRHLEGVLERYAEDSKLVGFRHILQSETDGFMTDPAFVDGVKKLRDFDFTYDILVYARQLEEVVALVPQLEGQKLIIDHLAKPDIKSGEIDQWKKHMKTLSAYDQIFCKVSGMITEASWNDWTNDDLKPYLDAVFEYFGPERCVYGSDWPVCTLAGTYEQVFDIIEQYLATFSVNEQKMVLGLNAVSFYDLKF